MENKIVKGGESLHLPFGTYRKGFDIRRDVGGEYYMSVMNGPFEIFKGPKRKTIEYAEKAGIEQLLKEKPRLAYNIGLR